MQEDVCGKIKAGRCVRDVCDVCNEYDVCVMCMCDEYVYDVCVCVCGISAGCVWCVICAMCV